MASRQERGIGEFYQHVITLMKRNPHVLDVIPPHREDALRRMIEEADYSRYGELAQDVQDSLGICAWYIEGSYIPDTFPNDEERTDFRLSIRQECAGQEPLFDTFYNSNKLRGNAIHHVIQAVYFLRRVVPEFPEEFVSEAQNIQSVVRPKRRVVDRFSGTVFEDFYDFDPETSMAVYTMSLKGTLKLVPTELYSELTIEGKKDVTKRVETLARRTIGFVCSPQQLT